MILLILEKVLTLKIAGIETFGSKQLKLIFSGKVLEGK